MLILKPDFSLEFVNEFIEQASKLMPGAETRDDLQKSLNVIAQSTLSKLDLVTREEFDTQLEVLRSTRTKVDELQEQVKELSELVEKTNHNKS